MYITLGISIMIHLKNDDYFWFILETQKEFNYGNRNYIKPISKDFLKILSDIQNDFVKLDFYIKSIASLEQILEKKYQRALDRNELI